MKIGLCMNHTKPEYYDSLKYMQIDYVELQLATFFEMSESEVDNLKNYLDSLNISCPAMNFMIPASLRVTGEEVDYVAIENYLNTTLAKVSKLGTNLIVFGSTRARKLDEYTSYEKGYAQMVYLLKEIVSPIFAKYNCVCAIEPLCDDNLITTISQGLSLVKDVDRDNVKLLIDFYHTQKNGEDTSNLEEYRNYIVHTHIACENGRHYPTTLDPDDYASMFGALKDIGYDGMMSLEGHLREGEDISTSVNQAVALLKRISSQI